MFTKPILSYQTPLPPSACCNCQEIRLAVVHTTACSDVKRHFLTQDDANNLKSCSRL